MIQLANVFYCIVKEVAHVLKINNCLQFAAYRPTGFLRISCIIGDNTSYLFFADFSDHLADKFPVNV